MNFGVSSRGAQPAKHKHNTAAKTIRLDTYDMRHSTHTHRRKKSLRIRNRFAIPDQHMLCKQQLHLGFQSVIY